MRPFFKDDDFKKCPGSVVPSYGISMRSATAPPNLHASLGTRLRSTSATANG
jgi:hypothetical protein